MHRQNIIQIKAADGHYLNAIYNEPVVQSSNGIIILHEIFGLTPFITDICKYWAGKGNHVIAPALYDRYERDVNIPYDENGYIKALAYKQRVLDWDKQLLDINAAKDYLLERNLKCINIIGYSWGGTLAWLSAAKLDKLHRIIAYYGTHIFKFIHEKPKCQALLLFAERDDLVPKEHVQQIQLAHPSIKVKNYPVGHGFRCALWKEYNAEYAAIADGETENFLKQKL